MIFRKGIALNKKIYEYRQNLYEWPKKKGLFVPEVIKISQNWQVNEQSLLVKTKFPL
ncbi:aspartyl-phosphate phosphatase Spo0E family protein [Bacillus sp. APMAM]|uniref:aspartyl-phosphate phosphatase Spo0E family protein n=1 Tax=Margalitia sp. FSL K6-0131 TaxID=2954604 RepID=UPI000F87B7A6|nr:aspartyl-phosphate phosphatase Spo0E family protein [Bacillus sp. APMAM]RTZ54535.1 aspartyl-phosphate phosphatase Spo0E family protein [Bacillus sp. SAJ1]